LLKGLVECGLTSKYADKRAVEQIRMTKFEIRTGGQPRMDTDEHGFLTAKYAKYAKSPNFHFSFAWFAWFAVHLLKGLVELALTTDGHGLTRIKNREEDFGLTQRR
jgi:hypothetical protein